MVEGDFLAFRLPGMSWSLHPWIILIHHIAFAGSVPDIPNKKLSRHFKCSFIRGSKRTVHRTQRGLQSTTCYQVNQEDQHLLLRPTQSERWPLPTSHAWFGHNSRDYSCYPWECFRTWESSHYLLPASLSCREDHLDVVQVAYPLHRFMSSSFLSKWHEPITAIPFDREHGLVHLRYSWLVVKQVYAQFAGCFSSWCWVFRSLSPPRNHYANCQPFQDNPTILPCLPQSSWTLGINLLDRIGQSWEHSLYHTLQD